MKAPYNVFFELIFFVTIEKITNFKVLFVASADDVAVGQTKIFLPLLGAGRT